MSTTLRISGLNHAACIFVPSSSVRPLLGVHVDVTTDLLARLSSDGTCAISARTHWVTATNFMGLRPLPRFRASLGATSAMLGQVFAEQFARAMFLCLVVQREGA